MYSFANDYLCGAHPAVLQSLVDHNMEQLVGYGEDTYSMQAAEKIKNYFSCPNGEVYFLVGGTQTNQVVISTLLKSYEGVIAASTGHVNAHEAGAIEYSGHKVLAIEGKEGKITADSVQAYLEKFYEDDSHEHMVFPGMVYISFPTEYGTLYSKKELSDMYALCRKYEIPLFIDGARLGYGLASLQNDVTPADLASLCDVFYVGGTKVGALCGEAVVFTNQKAPKHYVAQIKQHGALLAKGRVNGIQFDALFTDDLYGRIGKHAIEMAEKLKDIFRKKGYSFFLESPTNQQFIILKDEKLKELEGKVGYAWWERYDESHTVVRFATSWATDEASLVYLESIL